MTGTGAFQITSWDETTEKTFEKNAKLSTAKVTQQYEGDIQGESELQYLMQYETSGNATFVGFERISGTYKNETCTLILKHEGRFEQGVARSQFVVLADSVPVELTGLKGNFESTEGGSANYVIG